MPAGGKIRRCAVVDNSTMNIIQQTRRKCNRWIKNCFPAWWEMVLNVFYVNSQICNISTDTTPRPTCRRCTGCRRGRWSQRRRRGEKSMLQFGTMLHRGVFPSFQAPTPHHFLEVDSSPRPILFLTEPSLNQPGATAFPFERVCWNADDLNQDF